VLISYSSLFWLQYKQSSILAGFITGSDVRHLGWAGHEGVQTVWPDYWVVAWQTMTSCQTERTFGWYVCWLDQCFAV